MAVFPRTDILTGKPLPGLQPPPPPPVTVLGVAVGDLSVPAALCAVRYTTFVLTPGDPVFGELPEFETHYTLLGAEAISADDGYPGIARRVNRLAKRLYARDSRGEYHALVDASDAGRPVVDAIRDAVIPQCHLTAVRITTGDASDPSILWRRETTVGLAYLISRLQAMLTCGRLHVPTDPVSTGLLDLLRDYRVEQAPRADLVRALALACASEYRPIRYGQPFDALPSPRL